VFATIGRLAQFAALPLFNVVFPESAPWLGIKLLRIFRHKFSSFLEEYMPCLATLVKMVLSGRLRLK
jgi:hypothetical protein